LILTKRHRAEGRHAAIAEPPERAMNERPGGYLPWLALLVAGLAVAVAVVLYAAYGRDGRGDREPARVELDLPSPKLPQTPEGPKLPDAPIPVPR
jgi:hypothetical protein